MIQPPNILFIMTDQQRSDTIGALSNRQIRAPTLDTPSPEGADLLALAAGEVERQVVYSQFSEGNTGLYMIATTDLKYVYSAADQKEWLFDLPVDPDETKNWAGNPRYVERLQTLRARLIERFEQDGYDQAVEDGAWREYDPPIFPDPAGDDGLLFQDPPNLDELLRDLGPGYAP